MDQLDRSDRSALAGLATASQTGQIAWNDRSDRLVWFAANFDRQHMPSISW